MSETKTATRSHEIELTIDAPIDAVWKALTDARELTNWFPLQARVEPREGGRYDLEWGPEMINSSRIEIFEPPTRLRTTWLVPESSRQAISDASEREGHRPQLVEYRLEGRAGGTLLRLVHSGFGLGSEWDEEYDGTSRGWRHELRSLRHFLQHHRGKPRRVAWARQPVAVEPDEVWNRLLGPRGLAGGAASAKLVEGDRYRFDAPGVGPFSGVVQVCGPPRDFTATVDELGGALLRLGYETCFGRPEAQLWLSTWGRPETELQDVARRFEALLARLFPECNEKGVTTV